MGLTGLFLLLASDKKVWFWFGFFMAIFWFWWINLSLEHYGYAWGLPVGVAFISTVYGLLFLILAIFSDKIAGYSQKHSTLILLTLKAFALLLFSYIHPFGFDWYKPELMFVESYLGIKKWQFFLILLAMVLTISQQKWVYMVFILFAYQPSSTSVEAQDDDITLVTGHTTVEDKWNPSLHHEQFEVLFKRIDTAIDANKSIIVLPESVFPLFLNRATELIKILNEKAKHINIITGGLYLDGDIPRNSTFIFTKNRMLVAHKVVLVPFGESNPLPDFLSDWVNETFYDSAVDYIASAEISDYELNGISYRSAICFEATSEKLYEGRPQHMIVISNNGWFYPSTEPTLQKLLLQYYSNKYGTTIYHAINMSDSYVLKSR